MKNILNSIKNRLRNVIKHSQLSIRRALRGRTLWIDYGWMQLPFHGDGDRQELYYHVNGAAWWENERLLMMPYVKPGDVAVDVGANLGFISTLLSRLVGETGTVHSFEPSPVVFRKLTEVIDANSLKNVTAHNVGCGESPGLLKLHCTMSSGNSSLRLRDELAGQVRETQEVEIVKLDDYLGPKLTRLDFLKIDTEGYEDSVLAGAQEILRRFRPVIYLELTSEYLESSKRAVHILKELGYRFEKEPVLEECHNGENFFALPS